MGKAKVDDETARAMQDMRRAGAKVEVIAKRFGISVGPVYDYTRGFAPARRGPNPGGAGIGENPAREARIVERVKRGDLMTAVAIGEGISRERVRQIIRRFEDRTGTSIPRFYERGTPKSVAQRPSEAQRLLSRAVLVPATGCWRWKGPVREQHGRRYPFIGANYSHSTKQVRRVSYELWRGVIPPRHFVVPRCGDDLCINPFHLEAVSAAERFRQSEAWDHERDTWRHTTTLRIVVGGTCRRGHLLAAEDIRTDRDGRRTCKVCERDRRRRYYRDRVGG